ncbi:MAG: hypothetical protein PUK46_03475, partial [Ruminococcus sp.]|nr:hypothetical protein [Ruminococcus sp.]
HFYLPAHYLTVSRTDCGSLFSVFLCIYSDYWSIITGGFQMLSVVQMSKDNVYGRYCVRLVVIYDKIIFHNFA